MKRMFLAAIFLFSGNWAHAQVEQNGTCTTTSDCNLSPAPRTDDNAVVSFGSAVCVDTDADQTPDTCQWTLARTPCGANQRSHNGQCIASPHPALPAAPAVCQGVVIPPAECTATGGTLHYASVGQSGACVLQMETFICGEGAECVASGQQAYCAPMGPRLVADHRPASVGSDGGLTSVEWNRILESAGQIAYAASDSDCTEVPGFEQSNRCTRTAMCLLTNGSAEAATECWRQYLTIR